WRFCQQAHHYAYDKRIVPRRKALPLQRGAIIHKCLEAIVKGEDWRPVVEEYRQEDDRLLKEEREYYGDLPDEITRIMEGYEITYKDDPLKYFLIECKQQVPLVKDITLTIKADTLAEDKKGRL